MDGLTIQQAARTAGWSPRMLRYIGELGLVEAERNAAGYRIYGAEQLQRLRTLRELLTEHGIALGDVGFARRLADEKGLGEAVRGWLAALPSRPDDVPAPDWLAFEQRKHERLLASLGEPAPHSDHLARRPPMPRARPRTGNRTAGAAAHAPTATHTPTSPTPTSPTSTSQPLLHREIPHERTH
ncbi:MAG: MerR family transcriptional regulator [Mycobacteriales bacterium]